MLTIEYIRKNVPLQPKEEVQGDLDDAVHAAAKGLKAHVADVAKIVDGDGKEVGLVTVNR